MDNKDLCVAIPAELFEYELEAEFELPDNKPLNIDNDFGVRLIKDDKGKLICAAYYSDYGELIKKIFYDTYGIESIEHYRNNTLFSHERYDNGVIKKKSKYDKCGNVICSIMFKYDKDKQIISIAKIQNTKKYEVLYGYDELKRVNSRTINIDNKICAEQIYRYDILDRVVEYKDYNQTITVDKMNQKNELVCYVITDKRGNIIRITNKYLCSDYLGTEINLNGHATYIKDYSYTSNIILNKPFTSEEDLDFAISYIIKNKGKNSKNNNIKNQIYSDLSNIIILNTNNNTEAEFFPITVRKKVLLG